MIKYQKCLDHVNNICTVVGGKEHVEPQLFTAL
jgi:hypothetical protein